MYTVRMPTTVDGGSSVDGVSSVPPTAPTVPPDPFLTSIVPSVTTPDWTITHSVSGNDTALASSVIAGDGQISAGSHCQF